MTQKAPISDPLSHLYARFPQTAEVLAHNSDLACIAANRFLFNFGDQKGIVSACLHRGPNGLLQGLKATHSWVSPQVHLGTESVVSTLGFVDGTVNFEGEVWVMPCARIVADKDSSVTVTGEACFMPGALVEASHGSKITMEGTHEIAGALQADQGKTCILKGAVYVRGLLRDSAVHGEVSIGPNCAVVNCDVAASADGSMHVDGHSVLIDSAVYGTTRFSGHNKLLVTTLIGCQRVEESSLEHVFAVGNEDEPGESSFQKCRLQGAWLSPIRMEGNIPVANVTLCGGLKVTGAVAYQQALLDQGYELDEWGRPIAQPAQPSKPALETQPLESPATSRNSRQETDLVSPLLPRSAKPGSHSQASA